jgi:hypothetical protein
MPLKPGAVSFLEFIPSLRYAGSASFIVLPRQFYRMANKNITTINTAIASPGKIGSP